jgi:hypothetical protein
MCRLSGPGRVLSATGAAAAAAAAAAGGSAAVDTKRMTKVELDELLKVRV